MIAPCEQQHCLAVVDAGSTGSRVHIYAYELDEKNTPAAIKELWSNKITPGFSTLQPKQRVIDGYLRSLFARAPVDHIPVYFYATAGMRLLSQAKQHALYEALEQWFLGQPQWILKADKTITGNEEGLYSWLSVNDYLGAFGAKPKPVVGVMDMGGASVQISFPVHDTAGINPRDLQSVDIGEQHITLFVHSFLGLGQTILFEQFLDSPVCFAEGYQLPSGADGKGDGYACQAKVSKLITEVHLVNQIVPPILKKNSVRDWYTIGGLSYLLTKNTSVFPFNQEPFTMNTMLQQADNYYCRPSWEHLQIDNPENELLYENCLSPAYYYALIVNGYGISPQQPINYLSSSGDWTLGVVLHH